MASLITAEERRTMAAAWEAVVSVRREVGTVQQLHATMQMCHVQPLGSPADYQRHLNACSGAGMTFDDFLAVMEEEKTRFLRSQTVEDADVVEAYTAMGGNVSDGTLVKHEAIDEVCQLLGISLVSAAAEGRSGKKSSSPLGSPKSKSDEGITLEDFKALVDLDNGHDPMPAKNPRLSFILKKCQASGWSDDATYRFVTDLHAQDGVVTTDALRACIARKERLLKTMTAAASSRTAMKVRRPVTMLKMWPSAAAAADRGSLGSNGPGGGVVLGYTGSSANLLVGDAPGGGRARFGMLLEEDGGGAAGGSEGMKALVEKAITVSAVLAAVETDSKKRVALGQDQLMHIGAAGGNAAAALLAARERRSSAATTASRANGRRKDRSNSSAAANAGPSAAGKSALRLSPTGASDGQPAQVVPGKKRRSLASNGRGEEAEAAAAAQFQNNNNDNNSNSNGGNTSNNNNNCNNSNSNNNYNNNNNNSSSNNYNNNNNSNNNNAVSLTPRKPSGSVDSSTDNSDGSALFRRGGKAKAKRKSRAVRGQQQRGGARGGNNNNNNSNNRGRANNNSSCRNNNNNNDKSDNTASKAGRKAAGARGKDVSPCPSSSTNGSGGVPFPWVGKAGDADGGGGWRVLKKAPPKRPRLDLARYHGKPLRYHPVAAAHRKLHARPLTAAEARKRLGIAAATPSPPPLGPGAQNWQHAVDNSGGSRYRLSFPNQLALPGAVLPAAPPPPPPQAHAPPGGGKNDGPSSVFIPVPPPRPKKEGQVGVGSPGARAAPARFVAGDADTEKANKRFAKFDSDGRPRNAYERMLYDQYFGFVAPPRQVSELNA
ncbi:hypothetical protein DIPPA_00624 [Diplonema papillatum]|nr:hypothetical protein DIPPA_00624 [Diplonema papillatum]